MQVLLGSFLEEGVKGWFRAKQPEAREGLAGHLPPISILHHGKDLHRGTPKLLLCCSAPHQLYSRSAVLRVPLCKCSSELASGKGKTCFSSLAQVTSGCAKSHSRVTSALAMLISSIADVWEGVESKAAPGEVWRARGSAVPPHPCVYVGKGTAMPCYLSAGGAPLPTEQDPTPANISFRLQTKAGDTVLLEEEQAEMLSFACAKCPGSQPDVLLNLSGGCREWWASARGFTV